VASVIRKKAIKQVTDRGHSAADVAKRLGVSPAQPVPMDKAIRRSRGQASENLWPARRDPPTEGGSAASHRGARHSKKGRRVPCQRVLVRYAFIRANEEQHAVWTMCRVV
jgi:transposase-like protein